MIVFFLRENINENIALFCMRQDRCIKFIGRISLIDQIHLKNKSEVDVEKYGVGHTATHVRSFDRDVEKKYEDNDKETKSGSCNVVPQENIIVRGEQRRSYEMVSLILGRDKKKSIFELLLFST